MLIQLCKKGIIKQGAKIYISDSNPSLIGFYKNVKYKCDNLIPAIKEIWDRDYNEVRTEFNKEGDNNSVPKSCRFYYLIKKCFNGLYRAQCRFSVNVHINKNIKNHYRLKNRTS